MGDKMSGVFSGNQWTTSSGSTWSVVIEPDFVNQVAELCNHLALASAESRSASEELVTKAQAAGGADGTAEQRGQLVKEVLNAVATRGLNPGAEPKDLEGFTNLAVALISTTFEGQDAEELFTQLAEGVAKNASSESSATINAPYNSLSSLYNSLPSSASSNTRSAIVLRLFKLAVSRDDLTTLSTPLAALPQWLSSEWGITESSESDKLMGQFVEILEGSSSASETGETSEAVRKLLLEYCNQNTSDELKSKLLLHTLSSTTIHDIESLPTASSAANLEQCLHHACHSTPLRCGAVADPPATPRVLEVFHLQHSRGRRSRGRSCAPATPGPAAAAAAAARCHGTRAGC